MPRKIEISHRTIVFTVTFLIGLWFLFFIKDILMQLFVALLIMLTLNPTVTKLERARIPRAASVSIVYLGLAALLIFTVAAMVPVLVSQTTSFAIALPKYLADLHIPVELVSEVSKEITSQLGKLPSQILLISVSVFSNAVNVIGVLLFGLYFSLARKDLSSQLNSLMTKEQIDRLERVLEKLESRLGGWARGQLLLMFLVGFANFLGLTLLGVPFALPMGLLAGFLEAVPNIGPVLAAVPAIIVGFSVAPITGVAVMALAFLIQQIEAYFFVPKIMQKSAGVNPIITLMSLLVGFRAAGVVGAVLSIPVVLCLMVLYEEFYLRKA